MIILISLILIIIVLVIWFWPKKDNNIVPSDNKNDNKYLYSWTSDKYIYTSPGSSESNEYYFNNYRFDFYKDELILCYVKNNECEHHKYTITDNRILNIDGESDISNFSGEFYLDFRDNYVLISKNNADGESAIFKFNVIGGNK